MLKMIVTKLGAIAKPQWIKVKNAKNQEVVIMSLQVLLILAVSLRLLVIQRLLILEDN
jgi:hypothetical protein